MADGDVVFTKAKGTRRGRRPVVAAGGSSDDEGDVIVTSSKEAAAATASRSDLGKRARHDDVHYGGGDRAAAEVLAGDDAEAHELAAASAAAASSVPATTEDGQKVYTGEKNYATYIKARESLIKGAGLRAGPVKASNYAKTTTVIDYQPNVCKDYKQTGYCGYGHNCKFLHDRGDYKSGWEIERDWKKQQANGGKEENFEISSSDEDDALPFACFICKGDFVQPVVTKCGHYFCESCALAQERKTKRCFVCQKPTAGIFNQPVALIAKLAARAKAGADGGVDGSGDGGN